MPFVALVGDAVYLGESVASRRILRIKDRILTGASSSYSTFLASSEYLSFRFSSLIVFLQVAARRAASLQANHSVLMAKYGVVDPLDHSVMITPRDGPSAAAAARGSRPNIALSMFS